MTVNPIRILSVEDHPIFREGLRMAIESQPDMVLVAQAADAAQAIVEFRRHLPDITLMDLQLPDTNGIDVAISIRSEYPYARIIILTMSDTESEIQRSIRAGITAYVLKATPKIELFTVIRSVHAGRRPISSRNIIVPTR